VDVKFADFCKYYDPDLAKWIIVSCMNNSQGKCEVTETKKDDEPYLVFPETCALDCRERIIRHSKFILQIDRYA
jgi:hypothetical protein